ncbi:MAG: 16S rRNA (guanine(966)-N(2))-methyltransferase RsmD [Rhodothermaceae bacterium]|nr:16S rRNA (guanine(966)-N(2))-methyltransferase RsmD [Rhodothermaceae bacterium]
MRIIGGQFKRRTLQVPKGHDVRPTTDRVREALFNLLHARRSLTGARVLDLFAGSGALGLEAISRGAASVTFVDADPRVLRVARANATSLGVERACSFLRADALAHLHRPSGARYDLVFADPPYDLAALPALPALAQPHLADEGFFVLEHDTRHDFAEHPDLVVTRAYGRTVISIFDSGVGSS